MKKDKYWANRYLKRAVEIAFSEGWGPGQKNLFRLLRALALRMEDSGKVPMPMIDDKGILADMDWERVLAEGGFTVQEDTPLRWETLTNSLGMECLPLFTDLEELEKGRTKMQADIVLQVDLRDLLERAARSEGLAGIVVNAFGNNILLEQALLVKFLEDYAALRIGLGAKRLPILRYIEMCLNERGELPLDFRVPGWGSGTGDEDAACLYEGRREKLRRKHYDYLRQAVQGACSFDWAELATSDMRFAQLGLRYGILNLQEQIQSYITRHRDELDITCCYRQIENTLEHSADKETIKAALVMLEMMQEEPGERVKDMVRLLGRASEFTLFAAYVMRDWKNGRAELLDLQRHVSGWGSRHIVEVMKLISE